MTITDSVQAQQLWFTAPGHIDIRTQTLAQLSAHEVRVASIASGISAGTELLVYRGQLPDNLALDATLESLSHAANYPLQYGYACVGRVEALGADVEKEWLGKIVFAFQPHASHFHSSVECLIPVPDDISPEAAIFLANMETAVNLMLDAKPLLGERVIVLGQGVVGLLATQLLAQFPLANLIAADMHGARCKRASELGAHSTFNPADATAIARVRTNLGDLGADLILELSGTPQAVNLAIELSGYSSRIVLGSWYGNKTAAIHLGGSAHRNRLHITTSQVSSIAPELVGRWDKARRFDRTWDMIRRTQPQQLISHRVPLVDAAAIYQQLDQAPQDILQAIIRY